VFSRIYSGVGLYRDSAEGHGLAVLYMILALGTLLDLDKPPNCPEATRFYQIGRAALSLNSVLEEESITAIQALVSRNSLPSRIKFFGLFETFTAPYVSIYVFIRRRKPTLDGVRAHR